MPVEFKQKREAKGQDPGRGKEAGAFHINSQAIANIYLMYKSKPLQCEVKKVSKGKKQHFPSEEERRQRPRFFLFFYVHVTFVIPAVKGIGLGGQKSCS